MKNQWYAKAGMVSNEDDSTGATFATCRSQVDAQKVADALNAVDSAKSSYAIKQLVLWLEDNVEMDNGITFDNDGVVKSKDVLQALREVGISA